MSKRHTQKCSVAGFLNVFGDGWTLLVIREALYGATRFSEFRANTGIAKNLLSDRLSKLVDEGILATEDIGERGSRNALQLGVSTLNKSIWRTEIKCDDLASPVPLERPRAVPKVTRK